MTERGTSYDAAALEFSKRVDDDPLKIGLSQQLLARLPLPPDAVLIDLGCGPGQFLARCSEVHPQARLIGVDVSMGNLEQLRVTCPSASAVRADIAMRIPLAKNSADVVTMSFVASEIGNLGQLLQETSRILKPSGLLAMTNTSRQSDIKTHKYHPDKITVDERNFDASEAIGTYNLETAGATIPVPHFMRTSRWYIEKLHSKGLEMIPGGIQHVVAVESILKSRSIGEWFRPEAEIIYARKLPNNMNFGRGLQSTTRSVKQAISPHFPYDACFIDEAVYPIGADSKKVVDASYITSYHPDLNTSLPIDQNILSRQSISQIPY